MKSLIAGLALIIVSPGASATCAQIYDSLEYVCYVDGGRQVHVTIFEQEICGASYKALVNQTPVQVVAGPLARNDGGVEFDIAGPGGTTQSLGPCVEATVDVIQ